MALGPWSLGSRRDRVHGYGYAVCVAGVAAVTLGWAGLGGWGVPVGVVVAGAVFPAMVAWWASV